MRKPRSASAEADAVWSRSRDEVMAPIYCGFPFTIDFICHRRQLLPNGDFSLGGGNEINSECTRRTKPCVVSPGAFCRSSGGLHYVSGDRRLGCAGVYKSSLQFDACKPRRRAVLGSRERRGNSLNRSNQAARRLLPAVATRPRRGAFARSFKLAANLGAGLERRAFPIFSVGNWLALAVRQELFR